MSNHEHEGCCSTLKKLEPQDFCACCSGKTFESCCLPFISGARLPMLPVELMRSRYTAYTQGQINYIVNTMCDRALKGFNEEAVSHWAHHVIWGDLEVLGSSVIGDTGTVTFKASYEQDHKIHLLHEQSQFRRLQGKWFYVDALKPQKMGRNDPCHCGSGKKYKKCCAAHG